MLNVRPENGRTLDGAKSGGGERFGLRKGRGAYGLLALHLSREVSGDGCSVDFDRRAVSKAKVVSRLIFRHETYSLMDR